MLLSDVMTIIVAVVWAVYLILTKKLPDWAPYWWAKNGLHDPIWKIIHVAGTIAVIFIVLFNFWLNPYRGY